MRVKVEWGMHFQGVWGKPIGTCGVSQGPMGVKRICSAAGSSGCGQVGALQDTTFAALTGTLDGQQNRLEQIWGLIMHAFSAGAAGEAHKNWTARVQEGRWPFSPNSRAFGAGLDMILPAWGNFWPPEWHPKPLGQLQGAPCRLSQVQHRQGFAARAERLRCACLPATVQSLTSGLR